ncbi:glycoside hydrolase family 3 protein [Brochothrix thermosphacta]|uniref:beta-N-acetylhexosaminidase n=1 Tax=Brochothrix thermosphacta TaxID=2756 RepID=A0A1D2LK72_BROTH|nr:glycoside hydrolase family 3 N-terminal domain-containing protein [Brochothrix thermosphacta]ATF24961.1 beta-hexosaminidase [Brochothrix thermosphacta]ATH84377.1 beta-hexosaminidase [Brochothrix thermosphacta]MPQ28331.1 beta-hexosaminidase [Brochothrix thermosphacta]ODJ65338.1 beta-hexosaminidase [Brochothrix thermosphacta]ODJ70329.1 beta-hexosaminidase [Brochothrix thermosphacta]
MKLKKRLFFGICLALATVCVACQSKVTAPTKTTKPINTAEKPIKKDAKTLAAEKEAALSKKITKMVGKMTLEEKVGQLFLVRVPETHQIEDITKFHLGGYVLFSRDMDGETRESLKQKIASYQTKSKVPLLIASDEEGGTVSRLSRGNDLADTAFPSPQELYRSGGWQAIKDDIINKAEIFKYYGIQTGLAPVADVSTDSASFIYDRTIGLPREGTAEYVERSVKEMHKQNIGSTLKHFPGYGNNRDSHVEIVTDTRPLTELEKTDFLPFIAGIKAGADSVLVSHNIINAIDKEQPASISKPVHDLLRQQLGFKGVIMTDDMDMAGLADFTSQTEAGFKAIEAGNDLVLSSSYAQQIPFILAKVNAGELSEATIETATVRVLKWKYDLGLINLSS